MWTISNLIDHKKLFLLSSYRQYAQENCVRNVYTTIVHTVSWTSFAISFANDLVCRNVLPVQGNIYQLNKDL